MSSLKDRLRSRAGVAAFAASAAVFGALSVIKPNTATKTHFLVPIISHFVAAGTKMSSNDIRWVAPGALRQVAENRLMGYAKVPLFPGDIVSPEEIGTLAKSTVIVAVAPSNGIDSRVAATGSFVDIWVSGNHGIEWQSGPLPVVSASLSAGFSPSINVAMSLSQALAFEQVKARGAVELVGVSS